MERDKVGKDKMERDKVVFGGVLEMVSRAIQIG